MYENLSLFQKNWFINHGLGIHSDKILADSSNTKNTLKYLTTYSAGLPNGPKYLEYLKRHHRVSVVCASILSVCVYVCVKSERTLHDYRCHY